MAWIVILFTRSKYTVSQLLFSAAYSRAYLEQQVLRHYHSVAPRWEQCNRILSHPMPNSVVSLGFSTSHREEKQHTVILCFIYFINIQTLTHSKILVALFLRHMNLAISFII